MSSTEECGTVLSPEMRSELIRVSMANGYSRADANILCDLAIHAEQETIRALVRVIESAPRHLRLNLASIATTLVAIHFEAAASGMVDEALKQGYRRAEP